MFELVQQVLLGACQNLVLGTLAGYIRRRKSGCGLRKPGLSLTQRLEGQPIGTTFGSGLLPAAIAHHGLNLAIDTVAIGLTAHFRQSNAWDNEEGQGQKKLSHNLVLNEAGVKRAPEGSCNRQEPSATGRILLLPWASKQGQD
jgi:hypothetical protein